MGLVRRQVEHHQIREVADRSWDLPINHARAATLTAAHAAPLPERRRSAARLGKTPPRPRTPPQPPSTPSPSSVRPFRRRLRVRRPTQPPTTPPNSSAPAFRRRLQPAPPRPPLLFSFPSLVAAPIRHAADPELRAGAASNPLRPSDAASNPRRPSDAASNPPDAGHRTPALNAARGATPSRQRTLPLHAQDVGPPRCQRTD